MIKQFHFQTIAESKCWQACACYSFKSGSPILKLDLCHTANITIVLNLTRLDPLHASQDVCKSISKVSCNANLPVLVMYKLCRGIITPSWSWFASFVSAKVTTGCFCNLQLPQGTNTHTRCTPPRSRLSPGLTSAQTPPLERILFTFTKQSASSTYWCINKEYNGCEVAGMHIKSLNVAHPIKFIMYYCWESFVFNSRLI